MQFTTQKVAQDYQNLAHPNPQIREQANLDLLQFKSSTQAWLISKELLNFPDPNLEFLGAQVLYLKLRNDYAFLQEGEIDEIKQFVFENIYDGLNKFNPQTFKQLCASASVIGLKMIQNNWRNFIIDMINLANTSVQNLYAALEILATLCGELQNVDVQVELVNQVRDTLKTSSELVAKFLQEIIIDTTKQADITNKALECVSSWAQIRAFEILEYPGLIDSLLKKIDSESTVAWSIEALCEGIKHSVYADILSTTRIEYFKDVMPAQVKDSVRRIIKFLYEIQSAQKNLNESPFCAYLSELGAHVGRYFSVIIFENTEHSKAILQFLLMCTSHANRKTSVSTFEFWNSFAQDATKANLITYTKDTAFDFIPEAYIELFKILAEKCKLKSLKIATAQEVLKTKIYNVDADQEEDFDEDDLNIDFNKPDLTLREYRNLVKDPFESCYVIVSKLKEEAGLNTLFSLILPPLTQQYLNKNNINLKDEATRVDYVLSCEALIFGARCMLEQIDPAQPDQYIIEMIKAMLTLPQEDVLVRGVLNFINDIVQQVKNLPEYADQVFDYCLRDITNPLLKPGVECLQALVEVIGDKIEVGTLEKIVGLMDQAIYVIEDPRKSSQCISSVFYVGQYIPNNEMKIKYIQRALKSIQEKFKMFTENLDKNEGKILNDPGVKSDALRLFIIMADILSGFEENNTFRATKIVEDTILPFIQQSLDYICIYLELFHTQPEFVKTFSRMMKMAIRICETRLENSYDRILFAILKVFEADSYRNMYLLDTMSTLLELFRNSQKQKEWLASNFSKFNNFVFQSLVKTYEQSSDLLLRWLDVLTKVLWMYRDFFLSLNELEQIIDFAMRAFYEFTDIKVQRKSISFLVTLIGTKATIQSKIVLAYLPKILAFALIKLPDIEAHKLRLLAKILMAILNALEEQEALIIELFFTILNMDRYCEVESSPKEVFLKAMFLHRTDEKAINEILKEFARYCTDPMAYDGSIKAIRLKIYEKQQERANSFVSERR